jgi:hypothetical protein
MSDVALIVVALEGPVVAAGAALAATFIGARNDKKRWLREERRQAYKALLDEMHKARISGDLGSAKSAVNLVRVLGPEHVDKRSDSLFRQADELRKLVREGSVADVEAEEVTHSTNNGSPAYRAALKAYYDLEYKFAVEARKTLN